MMIVRESEVQTEPYSPDYRVAQDTKPELLALASLTVGQGLPVGMAELEMIERARAKRQWAASLPMGVDEASFKKRMSMLKEMELQEWALREAEIKRCVDFIDRRVISIFT